MNKLGGINTFQLGAESFSDKIYYYSKNYITWTTYNRETNNYTTKHKPIKIPSFLHWPFLRCLRMLYAKKQLVGIAPIVTILVTLIFQYFLSFDNITFAFLFPFLIYYLSIVIPNISLMFSELASISNNKYVYNPADDLMRNHAAEHLISEKQYFNKYSIYSFGCSNSHIIFWFLINLALVKFMPITLAYLLSMFISGELVLWLVFHQDSLLAKLFYPIIKEVQNFTLLEPGEQHLKTAQLAYDKLKELENARQ